MPGMGMLNDKTAGYAPKPAGQTLVIGVADALFTKVQQKVLAILFGNPGRSFYANEIIALAGSGSGAVQRELQKLESAGLVTVARIGRQKHYQANTAAAVYPEMRGLVLKTVGLVDLVGSALSPLLDQISQAFVYGSVAKGEDTATSDIDLMVISDTLSYAQVFAALEVATQVLGRTVNPTVYSRSELQKRMKKDNAFITRVWQQPKLWIAGQGNELIA
jgi:predicted nucleotidyltransferase